MMGLQEKCRVLDAVGKTEELFCQFTCRLKLRPYQIKRTRVLGAPGRAVASLLLVDTAPGHECRFFPLLRLPTLSGHQRQAESELEVNLLLGALGRVWQGLEQLQPLGEVTDRFHISRALGGSLTRLLPVGNSLLKQPGLGVVMGQQFRLCLFRLSKSLFEHLRNLLGETVDACS